jgi:NADH dehydrogenase FAD-containing subunit
VLDHAKGFKNLAEALYLRDHLLAQPELADASDDPARRRELCTFVVVGAGYTGTEVAVANPLGVPLSGAAAKVVTRGYHLYALPANRLRVATDWLNDIVEHRQFVRLGLIQPDRSGLAVAEQTDIYYRTDGRPLDHGRPHDHGRRGAASP